MFKKYGLTWGELPWIILETIIRGVVWIFPGKRLSVEELNAEGPRNYVPYDKR